MERWLILLALGAGCIRPPAVVITDRRTAVEQQASGSFRGLEEELEQAGLAPRPAPLTSSQLGSAGVRAPDDQETDGSDALRADSLLVKRCAGEALDGTLVLTLDPCTGAIDVPQVTRLVERINRERRQLWRWLAGQAPGKNAEQILAAWRETHLAGLVCGGQVQVAGGTWEIKKC